MDRERIPQPPVTVAWTGASGLVYGVRLVEVLLEAGRDVALLRSDAVEQTAAAELGRAPRALIEELRSVAVARGAALHEYGKHEFSAPVASGSAPSGGMAVCPCSMSTLARIATGTGDDLLHRAADVQLKERRRLVLVPRETPLAVHHLEHMVRLAAAGAVILPAMPGFYHRPETVRDLVDFVVQRVCDQLGVAVRLARPWGEAGGPEQTS